MNTNSFVASLNAMQSLQAQNANAYAEVSYNDPNLKRVRVQTPLVDRIVETLREDGPQLIILTGHAGDGKTTCLYQIISKFQQSSQNIDGINFKDTKFDFFIDNNRKCICFKDYSEYSENEQKNIIVDVFSEIKKGNSVLLVSNTGPLIKNISIAFSNYNQQEVQSKLIGLLDDGNGNLVDFYGNSIRVIDFVSLDNTEFSSKLLNNIINDQCWNHCLTCEKRGFCFILRNVNLLKNNKTRVSEFLSYHFKYLNEYGTRLTARKLSEQVVFMITAGKDCDLVKNQAKTSYLPSDLFFGYTDIHKIEVAESLDAVKVAYECHYDKKRMYDDERLLISNNYEGIFSDEVIDILISNQKLTIKDGWNEFLRRQYMFFNIRIDKQQEIYELLFSKWFLKYIAIKYQGEPCSNDLKIQILQGLALANAGSTESEHYISLNFSRNTGYVQNVRLVNKRYDKSFFSLKPEPIPSIIEEQNKTYKLKLWYKDDVLSTPVTLPLIDYFDELINGIINTNIDPQLSRGIENINSDLFNINEFQNKVLLIQCEGNCNLRIDEFAGSEENISLYCSID